MDITPHVNLLKSLRGERTNYVALIGEGVDNAFDAGANKVRVIVGDDEITFQDDGIGITRDRIASVFSLGDHGAMTTTQLGRFGVGIKSQAVNAGDIFKVVSRSRDGRVSVEVNWRHILKDGQWRIDDPRWRPAPIDEATGTTIKIAELRRPPKLEEPRIVSDLAQRFYPAIVDGREVVFNGQMIERLPEPPMSDIVERHISLSGDRSAQIRAGILLEPSKLNRVHVAYRHRVIMPSSTIGCSEYGGLTKMFARLQISGPWHLAKFKDDLTDEDEREELEEAVSAILRPILEKCSSASMSAKIERMAHLINDAVPPQLSAARPKRLSDKSLITSGARTKSGNVDPDKAEEDGPAKSKRTPRDRLLITFDGSPDEDGIGSFEKGSKTQPHRVDLSKDHPFVSELIEHRDEEFGSRCLLAVALAIFEEGRQADQTGDLFMKFGQRISKHLAVQDDGKNRVRIAQ